MPLNSAMGDIAHVIQLAIAPVFLLTAVGTLLNVLASRLGRTVDRRRVLVRRTTRGAAFFRELVGIARFVATEQRDVQAAVA